MAARAAGWLALVLALLATGAQARAAGPTLTSPPSVAGEAAAGHRLEAASGTWTSAGAVSYRYQWYRCDGGGAHCSSVHGATGGGYALTAKDVGKTIGLTVTASDADGSTPAYASLVGPIAPGRPLLVSTAQPQVTGLPIAGRTLQVTTGAWSPQPESVAYSWSRCDPYGRLCSAIPGATAGSYAVGADDVGHALVAIVVGRFGTTSQAAFSTATAPAVGGDVAGPTATAPPGVTGLAEQGTRLTASTGAWSGVGSIAYAYQWYRCSASGARCSSIHGATGVTYRTVAADVGRTLGLTVRATDSTGTAAAYAALVGPIAPARALVVSSAQPSLAGTPRPGSVLTASAGAWRPHAVRIAYSWHRCNENGRICAPIAGATRATYTVTAADAGHALAAVVVATAGTARQAAYSEATPPAG